MSFKINALFSSFAVSTSKPERFTLEPNISKFVISVFCNPSLRLIFLIKGYKYFYLHHC